MKDKFSREELIEYLELFTGTGNILDFRQLGTVKKARQAYEQIKSLLTPIPEEKRKKFEVEMAKNIGCYPYQIRNLLKALDNLREGKEG